MLDVDDDDALDPLLADDALDSLDVLLDDTPDDVDSLRLGDELLELIASVSQQMNVHH